VITAPWGWPTSDSLRFPPGLKRTGWAIRAGPSSNVCLISQAENLCQENYCIFLNNYLIYLLIIPYKTISFMLKGDFSQGMKIIFLYVVIIA
jgi:hypothetical protein